MMINFKVNLTKHSVFTSYKVFKRNWTYIFIPFTVLILLLAGCTLETETQQANKAPKIAMIDCQLASPGSVVRLAAMCGHIKVYEDRAANTGKQITLNLAIIPAVSRNPEPDPLFFLTGGPGQAATESYPLLSSAFERIHQKRDIILVDQRGTGKSNPLTCTGIENIDFDATDKQELANRLKECLSQLDANPALYTTTNAMQDLDQVRDTLGYQQINIYGVSYGTRAALTYLSMYPEHVRSVILDGVVPQDEPLGLSVGRDAQRALNLIFSRCALQPSCNQAFPEVRNEFKLQLEAVETNPVEVSLTHPTSGENTHIKFTSEKMGTAIRLFSYTPETAALLPLMIHDAFTQRNYQLLAATYLIIAGELEESITEGMGYSVLCSEDFPFFSLDEAATENAGSYLGDETAVELSNICQTWPHAQVSPEFKTPVQSDVPVLLLSGEADPVTPPENGDLVSKSLPNSVHLVAPGQGHNVIFRGCIPRIAADFIDAGSVQGLDTACVQDIRPLPFFVNFSGPIPNPRDEK
jgi:pimeloyl-ACP methyl ester carboxylesterase